MNRLNKIKNIEEANKRLLGESKRLLKENVSFETQVNDAEEDDGGLAKIVHLFDTQSNLQLTLTSWDSNAETTGEEPQHPIIDQFVGHRIRVTIEIVD